MLQHHGYTEADANATIVINSTGVSGGPQFPKAGAIGCRIIQLCAGSASFVARHYAVWPTGAANRFYGTVKGESKVHNFNKHPLTLYFANASDGVINIQMTSGSTATYHGVTVWISPIY